MGSRTRRDRKPSKDRNKDAPYSRSKQRQISRQIRNLFLQENYEKATELEVSETYLNIPTNDHVTFLLSSIKIIKSYKPSLSNNEVENLYNNSIQNALETTDNVLSYEQKENYKSIFRKVFKRREGSSD